VDGSTATEVLSLVTVEPAGANCTNGGSLVTAGVDTNGSQALDEAEVTDQIYVCVGGGGATSGDGVIAFAVLDEDPGSDCTFGGQEVTLGRDLDADMMLDTGEVENTAFACYADRTVLGIPTASFTSDKPCTENSADAVEFTSDSTDPTDQTLTCAWTFPAGSPSTSTNCTQGGVTFPSANPYNVRLIVTDEDGYTDLVTIPIAPC